MPMEGPAFGEVAVREVQEAAGQRARRQVARDSGSVEAARDAAGDLDTGQTAGLPDSAAPAVDGEVKEARKPTSRSRRPRKPKALPETD
jgi:hypothetical protein